MEHANFSRSSRALTAIAAVLALSATPVLAQEAQSVPPATSSAPPSSPISLPPPAIVLPDVTAAQPGPAPQTSASAVPKAERGGAGTPVRDATSVKAKEPAPPTVPTARSNGTAIDGALADGSLPMPVAAPAASASASTGQPAAQPIATAPASASASERDGLTAGEIAGLIAAFAIAGAGAAAMISRRRRKLLTEDETDSRPSLPEPFAPEPAPTQAAVTVGATMEEDLAASAAVVSPAARGDGPVPTDPGERRALLERMVAAPPDAGNPFRTHKARMRRARIQLQRLEYRQQEQAERFDWRTYPYRPAIKAPAPAAPEPVTA